MFSVRGHSWGLGFSPNTNLKQSPIFGYPLFAVLRVFWSVLWIYACVITKMLLICWCGKRWRWDINRLTRRGRMTHTCLSELINIGSDNGSSPGMPQAIICTNAGIMLSNPYGTNFNEILIESHILLFKKMQLKISSGKWRSFPSI